jgi:hypothetical protein
LKSAEGQDIDESIMKGFSNQKIHELTWMNNDQFDSIPAIEKPFKMIVKENNSTFYPWSRVSRGGKGHSIVTGTVFWVMKEYGDYYFVKDLRNYTGWVEKGQLKNPLHPDKNFTLDFTIGDSTGKGVLSFPVGVSSDMYGNTYVLDVGSNRNYKLHKYDQDGKFVQLIQLPYEFKKYKRFTGRGENLILHITKNGVIYLIQQNYLAISKDQILFNLYALHVKPDRPISFEVYDEEIYLLDEKYPGGVRYESKRDEIAEIKVYSSEGVYLRTIKLKNFGHPKDIKIRREIIYVMGQKIIDTNPIFPEAKIFDIQSGEGYPVYHVNSTDFERNLKIYLSVINIYNLNGKQIGEISYRNFVRESEIVEEDVEKYFSGESSGDGSAIEWQKMAVDDSGENIYIFVHSGWGDCSDYNIYHFKTSGVFKDKLNYYKRYCTYEGSPRSSVGGIYADSDLEVTYDGGVILADGNWVYYLKKEILKKAVEDIPSKKDFNNPTAIAIDKKGNIYVSDIRLNRLKKYNTFGRLLWSKGGFGKSEGLFDHIGDLAVDNQGNVYAVDAVNKRVQKFDKDGNFLLAINVIYDFDVGIHGSLFDIYINTKGNLIVYGSRREMVFTANGEFIEQIDRRDMISWFPRKIIDKHGNGWTYEMMDYWSSGKAKIGYPAVYVYDQSGNPVDIYTSKNFENHVNIISDLAFDTEGNLWIADPGSYQIKKFVSQ